MEEERRARVRRQLAALAALPVREEGEAPLVRFLQQHHPRRTACRRASPSRAPSSRAPRRRRRAPPRTSAGTAAAGRDRGRARPLHEEYSSMHSSRFVSYCGRYGDDEDDRHPHRDPRAPLGRDPRAQGARDRERQDDRAADRRARRSRRDAHRRRRQRLHRLHRRRRLPQRRPRAPARARGGRRAARALHAHRLHGRPLRALRRARRAAARARAVPRPRQGGLLQRRHRGGRERRQVRAALHQATGGDRLRRRLPRPHADGDDAHLAPAPVQGRDGAARARGLPRALPAGLPRPRRRDGARRAPAALRHAGRGRAGGGDHRRAGPGRGRLPAGGPGVHGPGCARSATSTGSA